jgi:cell division protein FtsQ
MIKHINLRSAFWAITLLGVVILSLSAAGFKQKATVSEVSVQFIQMETEEHFLTKADLIAQVNAILDLPEQHTIGLVDLEMLEESLRLHPFIKSVEAYVSSNNVLKLKVSQREPLFRVFDRRGDSYYIDREGYRMPLSKHYTARVPVATAVMPMNVERIFEEHTHAWQLYRTMAFIDADPFLHSLTEQIYQQADGTMVLVPAVGDAVIMIGDAEDLEIKFEKLKLFFREVFPAEGWDTFASIDLSYADQIVCKRRPRK